ncbi:lipoate--protein ligase family protein [Alkalihalobacillus pseudalcaliphilus]|uniref:lipoate--protein ligase family protein n=1 Tax=Alkalihalobacillus pseudalcaliphilus TaxID=79884 RepID=UPI00064DAB39|nr:biotin/lipoate A/B protein ligase family protein [Alkalihalobacillus pseudalcaliphilus]KMK78202.1 octanoyltransferase [Alkalihalobacillus pseudalcaliphilus]
MLDYLSQNWRFIDHSTLGLNVSPLHSFAYDDSICTSVAQSLVPPTLRTWVHHDTVVLGTQDSRLPVISDGLELLSENGYDSIVRNSGGLAVVLDQHIYNISLILKEHKELSIDGGYELMYSLIRSMFPKVKVEAGEIVGSYCPGSYDLSVKGRKFAGISQRRIRGGVAVQIYLCVAGSGSQRAELIKSFYTRSVQGQPTNFEYPRVQPETMASLSELIGEHLTMQDVSFRLLQTMQQLGAHLNMEGLTSYEQELFIKNLTRVNERNQKCLP